MHYGTSGQVAAFFSETIQGVGGALPLADGYLPEVYKVGGCGVCVVVVVGGSGGSETGARQCCSCCQAGAAGVLQYCVMCVG